MLALFANFTVIRVENANKIIRNSNFWVRMFHFEHSILQRGGGGGAFPKNNKKV
jgi:hypothetical protein